MQFINTFEVDVVVLTYDVGDAVLLVPFQRYVARAGHNIYIKAHDHGRCKLRVEWPHAYRDLGVHAEGDIVAVAPPVLSPRFDRDLDHPEMSDSVRDFLIENWERTNWHRINLPGRPVHQGDDQQPS